MKISRTVQQRGKRAFWLIVGVNEEEGGIWLEVRLRRSTKSRMEARPDHRVEGSVVVLRHQEAKAGSVMREVGTWQDDVAVGLSASLHPSNVL